MNVLVVLGVVLPWAIVALGCWVAFQLMLQNGRLLLRLEKVEQQLSQIEAASRAPPSAAPAQPSLALGAEAPDFELADLAGEKGRLSDYRGRRVLLVFFNPQCGYCATMAPDLAALSLADPLPVVVTTGSPEDNRWLLEKNHVRCPVLLQEQNEIGELYYATGTPMGYLIDPQGRIASPIAAGAQALLALAAPPAPTGNGRGHAERKPLKGARPLSESRILRTGLPPGSRAPEFTLPCVDGGSLSLAQYRGRRVLLVFSDPHCSPCNQLATRLEQLHRRVADIRVLMVSRGDEQENRRKVVEHGLTFPVLLQRRWEVSRAYGMFATPIGYLIDEGGVIAAEVAQGAEAILTLGSRAMIPSQEEGAHGVHVVR